MKEPAVYNDGRHQVVHYVTTTLQDWFIFHYPDGGLENSAHTVSHYVSQLIDIRGILNSNSDIRTTAWQWHTGQRSYKTVEHKRKSTWTQNHSFNRDGADILKYPCNVD